MFIKFVFYHVVDICKVFLLAGGLTLVMSSCETEYIPDDPDGGHSTVSGNEGNFNLTIRFADFGETDLLPATQSMRSKEETLSAARSMEPETNVIRVADDMFIYATLAVDPVEKAPAVKTRAFVTNARIRVIAYQENPVNVFTHVFDTLYYVDSSGALIREGGTNKINLPAGNYKLVAYSYNNPDPAPTLPASPLPLWAASISDIDPVNDLIWGESDTIAVPGGSTYMQIPITMHHKLSQVKLVATTGEDGNGRARITAFDNVRITGYKVNLTTENGTISKSTTSAAIAQDFNFLPLPTTIDTVKSAARTVYTGTPGDMPTIVNIGKMTVNDTTLTNVSATFAKSLQSGYSYTMTMHIGVTTDITDHIPNGFIPYVGAFWKAGQKGERLIRMPRMTNDSIDGVWTAQVVEGRDWILLDTLMTADPNVGWLPGSSEASVDSANSSGFESNTARLLIATGSNFVSGVVRKQGDPAYRSNVNDQIYFRIGANSTYNPTPAKPVRYGIVLLTYGNNRYRHRIWIRQGEGADYLFRNSDPVSTGGLTQRTVCRQFSPYNLTVADKTKFNQAIDLYRSVTAVNPTAFTAYPTQAGAYFQWANETAIARYAWAPTGTVSGWVNSTTTDYWSTLGASNETCPPGYRRPTDGATDTAVDGSAINMSEMRQSLGQNPKTGIYLMASETHSSWGYYADGFFDRRKIGPDPDLPAGGLNDMVAVSTSNNDVAYIGRLFYNNAPDSHASLFFPADNYRTAAGSLVTLGGYYEQRGMYWSSSRMYPAGNPQTWAFYVDYDIAKTGMDTPGMSSGLSIRCVVRSIDVDIASLWLSPTTGNSARQIQVTSNGPWTLDGSQPANATVSPTSGPAGTTTLTITRSETTFGLSNFKIKNTVTGETLTVTVDNYYIVPEDIAISNQNATNTETYTIDVFGGDESFTIVSVSPWITAVKLPTGELQLTVAQSPDGEERTGTITIAHSNDPTYQVTWSVLQTLDILPAFSFLTIRFTWKNDAGEDVDIAVEFMNNFMTTTGQPVKFDNTNYYPLVDTTRAVGYDLASSVDTAGHAYDRPWTLFNTSFTELKTRLLYWGGDARNGEGETVFLNAPELNVADPKNDPTGLPRYINMDVYAVWYAGLENTTTGDPITITVNTYKGGKMMQPGTNIPAENLYLTNFYNVDAALSSLTLQSQLNPPDFIQTYTFNCKRQSSDWLNFRTKFHYMATVRYDRYRHNARVIWNLIAPASASIQTVPYTPTPKPH